MAKVFSVVDFKSGLDVRKTALTAPGGSVRILENAVLNQGGEIMKRMAFVPMTTVSGVLYTVGHAGALHCFGMGGSTPPGSMPIPIMYHTLASPGESVTEILDVEPFDDRFYVCGRGASGTTYCWYDGLLVHEVGGGNSHGSYAKTWKSKMYRIDDKYLRFSGVNNPAQNDPASATEPGAGFINMALNDPDGEELHSMEVFYASMAVFSRLQTQIWTLDPDPSKDVLTQVVRIGTITPHSVVQFGTGDILFLSDSGVRSLKAQTGLTFAVGVTDVGSPIDLLLIPLTRNNPNIERFEATIQPIQGRYWLAIDDTIYVLSYFPAGNINAWSTFKPGFNVKNFAVVSNYVFCTDTAQNVYLYGGADRATYDSSKITVRTPHLSADNPTQNKRIQSIDVMCQGQWTVSVGMLPNNTEAFELVATIQDNTYGLQSIPFAGYGTHFGVHLEHQAPGPALLASLHFNIIDGVLK